MDKPTSLIIRDLKDGIVNQINESNLPLCVVEMIIKDIYAVVQKEAARIHLAEKEAYEESLGEQKEVV